MQGPQFDAINWWSWQSEHLPMGWFLLDFVGLVLLLIVAVGGPLRKMLGQRHRDIKRAVAQAAASHAKASKAHQEARHRLTTLELELRELELSSQRDGEAERAQCIAEAEAYAARLADEAKRQADEVVLRMQERLRRRMLGATIAEVEAAIVSEMTDDDHRRLIDEAILALATAAPQATKRANV